MRTMALVVFSLAFPYSAQASSPTSQAATKTLEEAILLARSGSTLFRGASDPDRLDDQSIVSQCRVHEVPRARPVVRRRYSHARAVCHSRVTVAREIESTAATSCSDKPPKYLSSTI